MRIDVVKDGINTKINMAMTRGDTERVTLNITNDGATYFFQDGDKVYFTVKKSALFDAKVIQKLIMPTSGSEVEIIINPEDTKSLAFGEYVYDIQLTKHDGEVTTVIPYSDFIIREEVTHE